MKRAFIGLGSNLGDRFANLNLGVDAFEPHVVAASPVYETDPVGGPEQDDYLNAVIQVLSDWSAQDLLAIAQAVEAKAGRIREVENGPRTLDVDILLVEGESLETPELIVPHPRMWDRRFVLGPLRDLVPELVSQNQVDEAAGDIRLMEHIKLR